MRLIGHLRNESEARTFSDYLYVRGIVNQLEVDKDGAWGIWVHDEDQIGHAQEFLRNYRANSGDPEVHRAAKQAAGLRSQEEAREKAAAKKFFDRSQIFRDAGAYGLGPLTLVLMAVCVVSWLITGPGENESLLRNLLISEQVLDAASRWQLGPPEIRHGQIWRILTPVFFHLNLMHLFFNMLWLKDLGSMVEARKGSFYFLLQFLLIGAIPNLAQYYLNGPGFGGMSGVVYGLLGYIWMKSKFDPGSGFFLHPTTVVMMLVWFVICFAPGMHIANTVHAVGLGMGIVWGSISATRPFSR